MAEQGPGVEEDGMAARTAPRRHPLRLQGLAQVLGGADPVAQVVLVDASVSPWAIASRSRPARPP